MFRNSLIENTNKADHSKKILDYLTYDNNSYHLGKYYTIFPSSPMYQKNQGSQPNADFTVLHSQLG